MSNNTGPLPAFPPGGPDPNKKLADMMEHPTFARHNCYNQGGTGPCNFPACDCKMPLVNTISNQDPGMQQAMRDVHNEITGVWIDEIEELRKNKLWDKHGPLAEKSPWWKRINTVRDCEAHTRTVQFEWTPKFCWYTPAIEINLDMREFSIYILCFAMYISWGNRAKRRQIFDNRNGKHSITSNIFKDETDSNPSDLGNFCKHHPGHDKL